MAIVWGCMPLFNKITNRANWIAVACAEHARRGCAEPQRGFMQVCHGKCAPLRRVKPGDSVAYYAPGFVPYRRDVAYVPAQDAPIAPLLDQFEFVDDRARWGYKFRFGLFEVSDVDMRLIASTMQANTALLFL